MTQKNPRHSQLVLHFIDRRLDTVNQIASIYLRLILPNGYLTFVSDPIDDPFINKNPIHSTHSIISKRNQVFRPQSSLRKMTRPELITDNQSLPAGFRLRRYGCNRTRWANFGFALMENMCQTATLLIPVAVRFVCQRRSSRPNASHVH